MVTDEFMNPSHYHKLCVTNILKGVEEGLSRYSNISRVAVLFVPEEHDEIRIHDSQNILRGHESKLREIFCDHPASWRKGVKDAIDGQPRGFMMPMNDLSLSGLISFGGSSSDFFFQMWFTDHHPDMCSIHPTERWLEQAASLLVHDYNSRTAAIHSSDYVLKNYALQAIADYIVDEREIILGMDGSRMTVPPILNDILNISKTREEGAWARGMLFFVDPGRLAEISFITQIQMHQRPVISNVKHIRKLLLAVERSDRKLVSDGATIIGITDCEIPSHAIAADFRGDHGFLMLGNEKISSFFDGSFHSTTREAKMVELEELLLDSDLDPEKTTLMFQLVSHLVHSASTGRYGCTLVIDLNPTPVVLSGHVLEPSLSLLEPRHLRLTCSLLKIDGAVHVTADLCLHGFGCLLDGKSIDWENMARGARYNSALRFSADHPRIILVVVSADRPVSIIHNGIEMNAFSHWRPAYQYTPMPMGLKTYLNGAIL